MKIGITADVNLTETPIINLKLAHFAPKPLVDVLVKNDVVPIILPILPGKLVKDSLAGRDGLIITGGHDIGKDLGPTAFVNSRHHQAVKEVAPSLKAVAQAPDGVIEAIENDDASVQAVQWHPENLWQSSPQQERLFTAFIDRIKGGF